MVGHHDRMGLRETILRSWNSSHHPVVRSGFPARFWRERFVLLFRELAALFGRGIPGAFWG